MQNPPNVALNNVDEPIEKVAETLERKFGDDAATYAESRSETAELRGAAEDAERWREVQQEIEEREEEHG